MGMVVMETQAAMLTAISSTCIRVALLHRITRHLARANIRAVVCTVTNTMVTRVLQRDRRSKVLLHMDLSMQPLIRSALLEIQAAMQVVLSASSTLQRSLTL
jgi:hypothetical protein